MRSTRRKTGWGIGMRLVSALTLAAFLVSVVGQDLALAADRGWGIVDRESPAIKQFQVETLHLPGYLGTITDSWSPASDDVRNTMYDVRPTVIHIQDAHCNYAAQHAIHDLIEHLHRTYGVERVCLEGGEGSYDLSAFGRIADSALREKTADYFVREGVLNGAEYFAIRRPGAIDLAGVEDTALYKENLAVYRAVLARRHAIDASLGRLRYYLSALKARAYSRDLIALDLLTRSFKEGHTAFPAYLAALADRAAHSGLELTAYPNIARLAETLSLEEEIDFTRAGIERDELIAKLTAFLPAARVRALATQALSFKAGRLGATAFHGLLLDEAAAADIDAADYPALQAYVRYVSVYEAVGREALFAELGRLEEAVRERLFVTPLERELHRRSRDLEIIRKIFSLAVTPEEYASYEARRETGGPAAIADCIRTEAPRYGVAAADLPDGAALAADLAVMERFYLLSRERDEIFVKNVQATGHRPRVTILVTGGFHTANLAKLFKERGISYVSIMPNFTADEAVCPYFRLLAGEHDGILQVLDAPVSTIAIYDYFCAKASALYGEDVADARERLVLLGSELLAGREGAIQGVVRTVIADIRPVAGKGERVEEIPGASPGGRRAYAVWQSPAVSPRDTNRKDGYAKTGILTYLSVIVMVVASFVQGLAHAAIIGGAETTDSRRVTLGQHTVISEPVVLAKILGVAKNDRQLQEKIDRAGDFIKQLPRETVELYSVLAEKAQVPAGVFLALELTETNGAAVLDPENRKMVISPAKAMGPLQVMLPSCYGINRLIAIWDAEIAETGDAELESWRDQLKYDVVKRFGFGSGTTIDTYKVRPMLTRPVKLVDAKTGKEKTVFEKYDNPAYDPDYARTVGALILALDYHYFSTHALVPDPDVEGAYIFADKKPFQDCGYDPVIATIASYNTGQPNTKKVLAHCGPWVQGADHSAWYRRFITSLTYIETKYHNVNFRVSAQLLLYVFVGEVVNAEDAVGELGEPDQPGAPGEAGERPDAMIEETDGMEEIVLPDEEGAGPVESAEADTAEERVAETAVDVTVDRQEAAAEAESPVPFVEPGEEAMDSQVRTISFVAALFWAIGGVIFMTLATIAAILKIFGFKVVRTRDVPSRPRLRPVEWPEQFMTGRIYDRAVMKRERARSAKQFTVVFDMDETLLWGTDATGVSYLRPNYRMILEELRSRGVRVVLWTSGSRRWARKVLVTDRQADPEEKDFIRYFDLVITRENYYPPRMWEYLRYHQLFRTYRTTLKNLSLLGYHVIVDDNPLLRHIERDPAVHFKSIIVPPFDLTGIVTKTGVDRERLDTAMSREHPVLFDALRAIRDMLPPEYLGPASPEGPPVDAGTDRGPGQIGKRARGEIVSGKKLAAHDSSGYTTMIDLVTTGHVDIPALKDRIAVMDHITDGHKETLLAVLSLLESSPPELYRYDELVEDLFGVADPGKGMIAMHRHVIDDPIALAHELAEYLAAAGTIRLIRRNEEIRIMAGEAMVGSPVRLTREDAKLLNKRARRMDHYGFRAAFREIFADADRALEGRIGAWQDELPDRLAQTVFESILRSHDFASETPRYVMRMDPIFNPREFGKLAQLFYDQSDRKARVAIEKILWRLGQWQWREIFWKAFRDEAYAWERDTGDFEVTLGKLEHSAKVSQIAMPQIHMDIIEYLDEDLVLIPAGERESIRAAAETVNAWIRTREAVDEDPQEFIRHVRKLHAIAAAALPDTVLDDGLSRHRLVDVVNAQRPLSFPAPQELEGIMRTLAEDVCDAGFKRTHPVLQAAEVYMRLTDMQYFTDGNRRVAKLMMDYYLMRAGLPALEITPENKDEFRRVVRFMRTPRDVADFIALQLLAQQDLRAKHAVLSPQETEQHHLRVRDSDAGLFAAVGGEMEAAIAACPAGEIANILVSPGGTTMRRFFTEEVVRRARLQPWEEGYLDLSRVRLIFATGLPASREQDGYFAREVEAKLPPDNRFYEVIRFGDGSEGAWKTVQEYRARIDALETIHLAVLGLGPEGQLGYNERGAAIDSRPHVEALRPHSRYYGNIREKRAFTVGMADILRSDRIAVIAMTHAGEEAAHEFHFMYKATAVFKAIRTMDVPASLVRTKSDGNFAFYLDTTSAIDSGIYVAGDAGLPALPRESGDGSSARMIPDAAETIRAAAREAHAMAQPCTIGIVIKGSDDSAVNALIEERFKREAEQIGRQVGQRLEMERGIMQYKVGGVTYIACIDDGTDKSLERIAEFSALLASTGTPKERTFAWVLSVDAPGGARRAALAELGKTANLLGLRGDYFPVSWQMLAGPLFANLIDSKSRPGTNAPERIDGLVDAIIRSICAMTGSAPSAWSELRRDLTVADEAMLETFFRGSFYITLPPMLPVSGGIDTCRHADLEVLRSL